MDTLTKQNQAEWSSKRPAASAHISAVTTNAFEVRSAMSTPSQGACTDVAAPRRRAPLNWYTGVVYPVLRTISDPEKANVIAKYALRFGAPVLRDRRPDASELRTAIWGREICNPIGLAAGFDKDAEVYEEIGGIGFGVVEIGTVTPKYQPGNPKPRVFRLAPDFASINRMGFPSKGLDYVRRRLDQRKNTSKRLVGINIGANKDSVDRAADYVTCTKALTAYADYLVCNVSSPNTPGLRNLQGREQLADLVRRVQDAMISKSVPLVVKIAPDVTDDDLDDIVEVGRRHNINGLIVGNTTLSRPPTLVSVNHGEVGGLSGTPLASLSTEVLKRAARRVEGQFPLIGCGGVSSGEDAYAKIKAGASLLQLYTALIYEGPPLIRRIKQELTDLLRKGGYSSVTQAVGADI